MSRRLAYKYIFMGGLALCSLGTRSQSVKTGSEPLKQVRAANAAAEERPDRIIAGHDTTIHEHPWQVALVDATNSDNRKAQFCAGSIVAPRWVLTAAHCVDGGTKDTDIAVLTGTATLISGAETAPLVSAGKRVALVSNGIIIHEHWNQKNQRKHDNDIALLHVAGDLIGKPISGWTANDPDLTNQQITITGWGALSWEKPPLKTNILQEVILPVVPTGTCNVKASYDNGVTNNMLCVGCYEEESGDSCRGDSCSGDSGGPATAKTSTKTKLVGIVSWGPDRCGAPKMPGVYTKVSQYTEWVRSNSGGAIVW